MTVALDHNGQRTTDHGLSLTMDIDDIIDERLRKWGEFLRERQATPVLMVGLTRQGGRWQFAVTACEEAQDTEIQDMLVRAIAEVRAGCADIR